MQLNIHTSIALKDLNQAQINIGAKLTVFKIARCPNDKNLSTGNNLLGFRPLGLLGAADVDQGEQ